MNNPIRSMLAVVALLAPLGASAALVVRASVTDCAQFGGFNPTNCPIYNPGNYSTGSSNSGPNHAAAVLVSDHTGFPGASTSHTGVADAVQGVVRMRGGIVLNAQYEYPSRLGGWTAAGGGWSEMLANRVVSGIDLPFDIDGAFDWDASGPVSGGASPGVVVARGRLIVAASLTPQAPGLPLIFDEQIVDFEDAGTLIDEAVTLHLRGLRADTDYSLQVSLSFQTLLAAGGCPRTASSCVAHASATGDLMHTAVLGAATYYDANGAVINGGLSSESGFDYQRGAIIPGPPGTVPVPATGWLLAQGLLALLAATPGRHRAAFGRLRRPGRGSH